MLPSRTLLAAAAAAWLALPARAQLLASFGACTQPGLPAEARCGTVQVPENRDRPDGRQLALNVVVIPARTGGPARLAMTFFVGGPGQAAAPLAGFMSYKFAPLRDGRDLLFVDQRGTGRSAPLGCALRDPENPQTYLDDFIPPARAAACRDSLGRMADLTRYGFPQLAHDIDAVRQALGYAQLDLWGGSYGTRAAQTYLRMYPARVRSVVLAGVVPPGYLQPRDYARDTDAALAGLLAECRADAACHAAFPEVAEELRAVADRIRQAPVEARILDTRSGRLVRLTLSYGTFAETLRKMMYDPSLASRLPFVVHRAYEGEYRPLVRVALSDRRGASSVWGLYLAITCSEDVPFIDPAAAAAENGRTLLGDYRVRQQAAACEGWPRYTPPADYHQPLRSDAPVLLVSGELDPVTPPRGGARAAETLPNGLHVVVPHAGHSYEGMQGAACVDSLIVRFVRQASARGLDTSCVAQVRRPPFVIDIPEAVPVEAGALRRLVGTYVSAHPPAEYRVEALDGYIRVRGADLTALGAPLSPTRFRWENADASFLFEFSDDANTLTIRTPGRTLALTRRP